MADVTITFENKPNDSLQVGDLTFYTPTGLNGSFTTNTGDTKKMGVVKSITYNEVDLDWDVVIDLDGATAAPSVNDYVYFTKDINANYSGVSGYYAEVKFTNNKTDKAELFSINSEVSESSK